MHGLGYNISLTFFVLGCAVLGNLLYRSTYSPRFIGVLFVASGICYLFYSFVAIVAPGVSEILYPWTLLPGFNSELTLCVCLLVKRGSH